MYPKNKNQIIRYKNKAAALLTRGCLMFGLVLLITASGCKKFLNVPTVDKVPQQTLFSNEQGFIDALTGVYLGMDKPNNGGAQGLYTSDLTMGMASVLANNYTNALSSSLGSGLYASTANYSYTDAVLKTEIAGIWGGMYNNVAQVNNLLQQIDAKKAIFTRDDYYRVKGESLALRALFHFDLARLFGQPPLTGANAKAIPYVTKMGVTPVPFGVLNTVLDSCISDLKTAKSILAQADTSTLVQGSFNLFTGYTQNHMNYWATQALLARVYLYRGDTINSMAYAKAVINSGKFPLSTSNVASVTSPVRDRLFSNELVFALYSTSVTTYVNSMFAGTTTPLVMSAAAKTALYTTTSGSANDYRYTSWFDNNSSNLNVPSKFFQNTSLPYAMQNIVPVLRISEMYYIVAECAARNGDVPTGLTYLNQVRVSRGLSALTALQVPDVTTLLNEIMKEYKKEFILEGQTFFYYKRLNMDLALATGTSAIVPAGAYVFPLPDAELVYNPQ
jgi:hypothetical protein